MIHSEVNALQHLERSTETSVGALSFQTHSPCIKCSKRLYSSGIVAVFFESYYRSLDGIQYLIDKDIPVFLVRSDNNLIARIIDASGDIVRSNLIHPLFSEIKI